MKSLKRELINEVLTGLMVAATIAAVLPVDVLAQNLDQATQTAGQTIVQPALRAVGLISYALGAVMVVAGIANAKKHADQPSSNPLGPAIGKLGAGAAFLAAPSVIAVLQGTGTGTTNGGQSTFQTIGF